MRFKSLIILLLIFVSLIPFYLAGKWIGEKLQPRLSFRRFIYWMLALLLLIFVYTFLVVLVIRILFPVA